MKARLILVLAMSSAFGAMAYAAGGSNPCPGQDGAAAPLNHQAGDITHIAGATNPFVKFKCTECHNTNGDQDPAFDNPDALKTLLHQDSSLAGKIHDKITRTDKKRMPPPRKGDALKPDQVAEIDNFVNGLAH